MFDYGPDIALLQGSVFSATRQHSSDNEQALVNAVLETLSIAMSEQQPQEHSHLNSRFHAVLFYNILKDQNVLSEELIGNSSYFEAVDGLFPSLKWNHYFELLKGCKWKEQFCECLQALPIFAACDVLKALLEYMSSSCARCASTDSLSSLSWCDSFYLLECALLTLLKLHCGVLSENEKMAIRKWFKIEIQPCANENDKSMLKDIYQELLHLLNRYLDLEYSTNLDNKMTSGEDIAVVMRIMKVNVVTTFLSVLKHICETAVNKIGERLIDSPCLKTLQMWHDTASEYFDSEFLSETKMFIESCSSGELFENSIRVIKQCEDYFKYFAEAINSGDIGLPINFRDEILNKSNVNKARVEVIKERLIEEVQVVSTPLNRVVNFFMSITDDKKSNPEVLKNIYYVFNHISAQNANYHSICKDEKEARVQLLLNAIENKLLGYKEAFACILLEEDLNNDIISECVSCNFTLLSHPVYLEMLMNRLVKDYPGDHCLVQTFVEAFSNIPVISQESLLASFLKKDNGCNSLKLIDFDQSLTLFLNHVSSEQSSPEIAREVLTLCIQSPDRVIFRIIQQACSHGGQIPILVQMLVTLISASCYQREPDKACLFVSCLREIITNMNTMKEAQNIKNLLKLLLQKREAKEYVNLLAEQVINFCVTPLLFPTVAYVKLEFCLELLQAIFQEPQVSMECLHVNKSALIFCLCQVLDYMMLLKNGLKKELIVSVLYDCKSSVKSLPGDETLWLQNKINNMNPLLKFYIKELINTPLNDRQTKSSMLNLCKQSSIFGCVKEMKAAWKENLNMSDTNYTSVVISLSQILPGNTYQEWHNLFETIKSVLEEGLLTVPKEMLMFVPEDGKHGIVAFGVFVDSLLIVHAMEKTNYNWNYLTSCFSKLLQDICNTEQKLCQTVFYFCEVCRLAIKLLPEYSVQMTVPLCELLNICGSLREHLALVNQEWYYSAKTLVSAVKILPACEAKVHLQAKLTEICNV